VAEELRLSPREGLRQASRFLLQKAATRVVAMGPEQARQEALVIASVRAELGVTDDLDEEHARPGSAR
jgi:glycerol-3-phosphate dehydrogenase